VYEDDEEIDQTKAPGMRGSPAPEQRGAPMMQTMGAPGGDMRTMSAGGPMGGRMGGGPQMPWHQQQQGQPNWGSIVDRFRQRFAQHNPFMQRGGAPGGMPPGGAPQPQPGAAPPGGMPPGAPQGGPPQGANPWAARIAEAAQRFGGNRQPGGIMGGRGQY
jgi:hypothetical protein